MAMPIRVKTVWFKKDGERSAEEIATAVATTTWRVADKAVDNLGRENYDIITPARGFKLIAEFLAFLVHYCDRMAYATLTPERRIAVLQAVANRLGEVMEQNVREVVGKNDPRNYKQEFIDFLNRRFADYAEFEFSDEEKASFPALRFLGLQIRDEMGDNDKTWIMDQIMDIEMPEMMGTVRKSFKGLLSDAPVKRGFGSPDMLPPE
ncbi:MAG: hypothetical protein J0I46_09890 [Thiobacillus sp.]|uniref:hypothetical protein n=1 Tax=unclassified Thiobacillus TaxID=2646513 RepID=UPI00095CCD2F|nr:MULTISPECIES: hypothetical protein [unclassified Thiobacillus]MBN8771858.1 hypothetical protein [Thiobacillus sp.]MBN8778785.1 hypothetical protein [Thiobacillus sp.]MBS0312403.1 hypothetical protein [Pseudomonadota bacterium]OJY59701.1 MAG: hypothetical protein BGP19_12360 [Thiobacillus sp. 0-1251]